MQPTRLLLFTDLSVISSLGNERVAGAAQAACDLFCSSKGLLPSTLPASNTLLDSRYDNDSLEVVPKLRNPEKLSEYKTADERLGELRRMLNTYKEAKQDKHPVIHSSREDTSPRQLQHLLSVMHRKLEKYSDAANLPASFGTDAAGNSTGHTCVIILSSIGQQTADIPAALEQCVSQWKALCNQVIWVECDPALDTALQQAQQQADPPLSSYCQFLDVIRPQLRLGLAPPVQATPAAAVDTDAVNTVAAAADTVAEAAADTADADTDAEAAVAALVKAAFDRVLTAAGEAPAAADTTTAADAAAADMTAAPALPEDAAANHTQAAADTAAAADTTTAPALPVDAAVNHTQAVAAVTDAAEGVQIGGAAPAAPPTVSVSPSSESVAAAVSAAAVPSELAQFVAVSASDLLQLQRADPSSPLLRMLCVEAPSQEKASALCTALGLIASARRAERESSKKEQERKGAGKAASTHSGKSSLPPPRPVPGKQHASAAARATAGAGGAAKNGGAGGAAAARVPSLKGSRLPRPPIPGERGVPNNKKRRAELQHVIHTSAATCKHGDNAASNNGAMSMPSRPDAAATAAAAAAAAAGGGGLRRSVSVDLSAGAAVAAAARPCPQTQKEQELLFISRRNSAKLWRAAPTPGKDAWEVLQKFDRVLRDEDKAMKPVLAAKEAESKGEEDKANRKPLPAGTLDMDTICATALKQVEPLLSELRQCSQQSLQDALKASQEDRDKEYQWTATLIRYRNVPTKPSKKSKRQQEAGKAAEQGGTKSTKREAPADADKGREEGGAPRDAGEQPQQQKQQQPQQQSSSGRMEVSEGMGETEGPCSDTPPIDLATLPANYKLVWKLLAARYFINAEYVFQSSPKNKPLRLFRLLRRTFHLCHIIVLLGDPPEERAEMYLARHVACLQDACYQYLHLRQILVGPVGEQGAVGDKVGNNFFADVYPRFKDTLPEITEALAIRYNGEEEDDPYPWDEFGNPIGGKKRRKRTGGGVSPDGFSAGAAAANRPGSLSNSQGVVLEEVHSKPLGVSKNGHAAQGLKRADVFVGAGNRAKQKMVKFNPGQPSLSLAQGGYASAAARSAAALKPDAPAAAAHKGSQCHSMLPTAPSAAGTSGAVGAAAARGQPAVGVAGASRLPLPPDQPRSKQNEEDESNVSPHPVAPRMLFDIGSSPSVLAATPNTPHSNARAENRSGRHANGLASRLGGDVHHEGVTGEGAGVLQPRLIRLDDLDAQEHVQAMARTKHTATGHPAEETAFVDANRPIGLGLRPPLLRPPAPHTSATLKPQQQQQQSEQQQQQQQQQVSEQPQPEQQEAPCLEHAREPAAAPRAAANSCEGYCPQEEGVEERGEDGETAGEKDDEQQVSIDNSKLLQRHVEDASSPYSGYKNSVARRPMLQGLSDAAPKSLAFAGPKLPRSKLMLQASQQQPAKSTGNAAQPLQHKPRSAAQSQQPQPQRSHQSYQLPQRSHQSYQQQSTASAGTAPRHKTVDNAQSQQRRPVMGSVFSRGGSAAPSGYAQAYAQRQGAVAAVSSKPQQPQPVQEQQQQSSEQQQQQPMQVQQQLEPAAEEAAPQLPASPSQQPAPAPTAVDTPQPPPQQEEQQAAQPAVVEAAKNEAAEAAFIPPSPTHSQPSAPALEPVPQDPAALPPRASEPTSPPQHDPHSDSVLAATPSSVTRQGCRDFGPVLPEAPESVNAQSLAAAAPSPQAPPVSATQELLPSPSPQALAATQELREQSPPPPAAFPPHNTTPPTKPVAEFPVPHVGDHRCNEELPAAAQITNATDAPTANKEPHTAADENDAPIQSTQAVGEDDAPIQSTSQPVGDEAVQGSPAEAAAHAQDAAPVTAGEGGIDAEAEGAAAANVSVPVLPAKATPGFFTIFKEQQQALNSGGSSGKGKWSQPMQSPPFEQQQSDLMAVPRSSGRLKSKAAAASRSPPSTDPPAVLDQQQQAQTQTQQPVQPPLRSSARRRSGSMNAEAAAPSSLPSVAAEQPAPSPTLATAAVADPPASPDAPDQQQQDQQVPESDKEQQQEEQAQQPKAKKKGSKKKPTKKQQSEQPVLAPPATDAAGPSAVPDRQQEQQPLEPDNEQQQPQVEPPAKKWKSGGCGSCRHRSSGCFRCNEKKYEAYLARKQQQQQGQAEQQQGQEAAEQQQQQQQQQEQEAVEQQQAQRSSVPGSSKGSGGGRKRGKGQEQHQQQQSQEQEEQEQQVEDQEESPRKKRAQMGAQPSGEVAETETPAFGYKSSPASQGTSTGQKGRARGKQGGKGKGKGKGGAAAQSCPPIQEEAAEEVCEGEAPGAAALAAADVQGEQGAAPVPESLVLQPVQMNAEGQAAGAGVSRGRKRKSGEAEQQAAVTTEQGEGGAQGQQEQQQQEGGRKEQRKGKGQKKAWTETEEEEPTAQQGSQQHNPNPHKKARGKKGQQQTETGHHEKENNVEAAAVDADGQARQRPKRRQQC